MKFENRIICLNFHLGSHDWDVVIFMEFCFEMLGDVSPCLEPLVTDGTLEGPVLLWPVAQQMLLYGVRSRQHLPASLRTRHCRLVTVFPPHVDAQRPGLVVCGLAQITAVEATLLLYDGLRVRPLDPRNGPGNMVVLPHRHFFSSFVHLRS